MYIEKLVDKAIACNNCSLCCKFNSVFILEEEAEKMANLKVPLINIDGKYFIKQNNNGRCPNLTDDDKCSIYNDRPLACKLHPFYLMDRRGAKNSWVKFTYCPDENKILKESTSRNQLRFIAYELEKYFSPVQIIEMLESDKIISKYDRLETGVNEFIEIIKSYVKII